MAQLIRGLENPVLLFFAAFTAFLVYFVILAIKRSKESPVPGQGSSQSQSRRIGSEQYSPSCLMFSCPICMEHIKDELQANCGHIYCAGCITALWTSRAYAQLDCPYCRRLITILFEYHAYTTY